MNKISLIVHREFSTRVRKKSFIIMSILGPFLFAAFMIIPAWMTHMEDKDVKTIAVVDSSHLFIQKLPETQYVKYKYLQNTSIAEQKRLFEGSGYYALLYISESVSNNPQSVMLMSDKQPSFSVVEQIKGAMEKELERQKLRAYHIENIDQILSSVKTTLDIQTVKWVKGGEEKTGSAGVKMVTGYVGAFLIYFFIFLFGSQVMRGVIEEKTNRIVEVMVSSVKPFELMMGKIIGIALVGLTQFLIWVILTFSIVVWAQKTFFPDLSKTPTEQVGTKDVMQKSATTVQPDQQLQQQDQELQMHDVFSSVKEINWAVMLGSFIFFFLAGYLLYASLFAAIGSAVDSETDTQQFMLPITIPLILAIFVMVNAIENPEGPIAFWFSLIPFTSPIIMLARIPFGVPYWQLTLSIALLILTFLGTTWMAAKIYRTGILMYGKKVNYKELWKWLKYKN